MSESTELIVIIRPSFMKFCQDGCRAAAFNHALYWIARKAIGEPVERIQEGKVMWYSSTEEMTEGLANAWGVCKVRQEVNQLISMGLLGRSHNPTWGVDRTKHFFFGSEQCAKLLELCDEHNICLFGLGLSSDVLHLIKSSNASDKSITCKCGIHQMETMKVSNASDKSIKAIPKDDTKVTAKDTNKGRERTPASSQKLKASLSSLLSPKGFSFFEVYTKQGYTYKPTTYNQKFIDDCETLGAEIQSAEDLLSLFEYTRKKIGGLEDATVYLGNLAKHLPGWIQERDARQSDPYRSKPEPTEHKPDDFLDELAYEYAEKLQEAERWEELRDELRRIWQLTAEPEDQFRAEIESVYQSMIDEDDKGNQTLMPLEEAQRFAESLVGYLFGEVAARLSVPPNKQ